MLWLVIFIIAVSLLWHSIQRPEKNLPPTMPRALPIIGYTHLILRTKRNDRYEMVKELSMDALKVGGVGVTTFGPCKGVFISDPDDALTVLNSCVQKDQFYDFFKPWLGSGIFTADSDLWKYHKKLLLPAFSPRLLNTFAPIFNKRSKELVETLSSMEGKGEFDVSRHISVNVLQTFMETFMSRQVEDKQILNKYIDAVEEMSVIVLDRVLNLFYHSDILFRCTPTYRRAVKATKLMHDFTDEIILKKHSRWQHTNDDLGENKAKNKIFIDVLHELEEKGIYTETDVRREVDSFIFGGHDTSAVTMIYELVVIGSYQEVQSKMYEEILSVIGNGDVTVQNASQLVYMEAVMKEVMRLYPIVLGIARCIDRKVQLKNGILPAGYRCIICLYGINMHSMWGADAAQFRPERWLSPESLPASAAAFATFSLGQRACLGKMYSMLTMKTMLVHLLRRYRLMADYTKMNIMFEPVSKPKYGHFISLEPRINNKV